MLPPLTPTNPCRHPLCYPIRPFRLSVLGMYIIGVTQIIRQSCGDYAYRRLCVYANFTCQVKFATPLRTIIKQELNSRREELVHIAHHRTMLYDFRSPSIVGTEFARFWPTRITRSVSARRWAISEPIYFKDQCASPLTPSFFSGETPRYHIPPAKASGI